MINIRRSNDRGHAEHGWLDSFHTFSFGDYHDPRFMGFRKLRVINEDRVLGGEGFGAHPHRDMEIISYVLEGELEHKDSMGTGSVIHPGDVQLLSAGSGVTHSEFNHSKKEKVHFFQIWVVPAKVGLKPSYQQKTFSEKDKKDRLCLIVSPEGKDGALKIHQDVFLYASILNKSQDLSYLLKKDRHVWVQVIKGSIVLNDKVLKEGDGASVSEEVSLQFFNKSLDSSEFLLFDLN